MGGPVVHTHWVQLIKTWMAPIAIQPVSEVWKKCPIMSVFQLILGIHFVEMNFETLGSNSVIGNRPSAEAPNPQENPLCRLNSICSYYLSSVRSDVVWYLPADREVRVLISQFFCNTSRDFNRWRFVTTFTVYPAQLSLCPSLCTLFRSGCQVKCNPVSQKLCLYATNLCWVPKGYIAYAVCYEHKSDYNCRAWVVPRCLPQSWNVN